MSQTLLDNVINRLKENSKVLFVWSGQSLPDNFQSLVEKIQERVGKDQKISVEHVERLSLANHTQSSFDFVLSNLLTSGSADPSSCTTYLKLLKPNGFFIEFGNEASGFEKELTLSGFKSVQVEKNGGNLMAFIAEKPNFEVGASSKLKFVKKQEQIKPKVWKFDDDDIQEDDLINTDDLLDAMDLKKPDIMDKFDCGTSKEGKKKACKNCSCGLAEEIEQEATNVQKTNKQAAAKSACGSCYLGDAFRCASCPYLGMPAFKPGEKIQLDEKSLKVDI